MPSSKENPTIAVIACLSIPPARATPTVEIVAPHDCIHSGYHSIKVSCGWRNVLGTGSFQILASGEHMARLRDAAAAFAAVAAGWIIFPHDASAYEIDPWLGNTLSGASQTSGGTQTSFSASASYIDLGYGSFNDSASANLATGQLNASSANSTTGPIHFLGIAGSFVNDRLTILGNWTGTIPVSVTLAAQASFSGLGTPTYAQGYGSVSALASLPGNVAESATSIVSLGYKLGSTFVVPSSFPAPQASGGASVSSKIISLNSTAATFTVTDTILVSDTNPGCCPVSGPSVLS